MKYKLSTLIALASIAFVLPIHAQEKATLSAQKPSVSESEYLYEIEDNEILVNDNLITLFAFSKDGISASYRNKTDEKKKPKYTFRVYNAYGMLIGEKELGGSSLGFGNSTYMEPGAVASEKIYLKRYPLDEILKHTNIDTPPDLLDMKWVVLSETNTKE